MLIDLQESKCHPSADDELVDLVQHVVDQLDLVGDLRASEDGQKWSRRVVEGLVEVGQLLLQEEPGCADFVALAEHAEVEIKKNPLKYGNREHDFLLLKFH